MTKTNFNLAALMNSLGGMDQATLDKLLLLFGGYGNPRTVDMMLKAGANIDAKDSDDRTSLHYAASTARSGRAAVVELLIAEGAAIDARENDGSTPLHYASCNGHAEVAAELIAKGAAIDAKDSLGWPVRLRCRDPVFIGRTRSHRCSQQ